MSRHGSLRCSPSPVKSRILLQTRDHPRPFPRPGVPLLLSSSSPTVILQLLASVPRPQCHEAVIMAFQSSVFRNGQWVTETVNLQDALRASAVPKPTSAPRAEPPVCGLLSTTIVESPVVHWALPVRLRSRAHNDVAFIGVSPFSFSEKSVSYCLFTLCCCSEI